MTTAQKLETAHKTAMMDYFWDKYDQAEAAGHNEDAEDYKSQALKVLAEVSVANEIKVRIIK